MNDHVEAPQPSGWGLHLYLTADEQRRLAEIAHEENTTPGKLAQRLVREYLNASGPWRE